ncbi:cysteine desulfurase family protein [Robertkochia flava]|uniref:cysteine desulfurase family protein n=1 Tax=Robertkochia flava TaxID=3447986 RepID=UPI001CCF298A|nr:cysteine desulfurase family protein [Robertkochia marina]
MESRYAQIYLDYNATTPCDSRVAESMWPYFTEHFGNASSSHHPYGWLAKDALEEATGVIAAALGVQARELVFTSGSTESINSVLKGVFRKSGAERNHIITSKAEHKAVLDVCAYLETQGAKVTYLDVTPKGLIDMEQLEQTISENTLIVAVMLANNETGVIQELDQIAALCKTCGSLLFSDATQALGKIGLGNFFDLVDFACFSGHKLYGPKGIGLTYISEERKDVLDPFIHGGGQQSGWRGGTYNTPAIVGLAKAVRLAVDQQVEEGKRLGELRDQLEHGLLGIEETVINGSHVNRLPNTLNISFKYVDGEALLRALSTHMAVSNGSACNSASVNPSHVLKAMGLATDLAFSSLRFSLGRYTTPQDVEKVIDLVIREVSGQRASNILWERRSR